MTPEEEAILLLTFGDALEGEEERIEFDDPELELVMFVGSDWELLQMLREHPAIF